MKFFFLVLSLTVLSKYLAKQNFDLYLLIETSDSITRTKFDTIKMQVYDLIFKLNRKAVQLVIITTGQNKAIRQQMDTHTLDIDEFTAEIFSELRQENKTSIYKGLQMVEKMLRLNEIDSMQPKIVFLLAKNFNVHYYRRIINNIERSSHFYLLDIDKVNATKIFNTANEIVSNSRTLFVGLNEKKIVQLDRNEEALIKLNIDTKKGKIIRIILKVLTGGFLINYDNKNLNHGKSDKIIDIKIICLKSSDNEILLNIKLKGAYRSNNLTVKISEHESSCYY